MANKCRELACFSTGVYLVHLRQLGVVDHIVVVDAGRKLILDSEEPYPMTLSEGLLRKCGGDEVKHLTIACGRRLIEQRDV